MYRHRFRTRAALDAVAAFHRQSPAWPPITPPPVRVVMGPVPAELAEGDELAFTLRLGPLAIPWTARIEAVRPDASRTASCAAPSPTGCTCTASLPAPTARWRCATRWTRRLCAPPWWFLVGLGMKLVAARAVRLPRLAQPAILERGR